jgi:hypothetical protein
VHKVLPPAKVNFSGCAPEMVAHTLRLSEHLSTKEHPIEIKKVAGFSNVAAHLSPFY